MTRSFLKKIFRNESIEKMQIRTIENQTEWDSYVESVPHISFLQSWDWGQFINSKNGEAFYWFLEQDNEVVGASLITFQRSKRGAYLECIGGPVWGQEGDYLNYSGIFRQWLVQVNVLAKDIGAHFLRLRIPVNQSPDIVQFLQSFGFRETALYYQAELTRQIDLNVSEDDLLLSMKKKTRYEINRAEKEGVSIETYSKNKHSNERTLDEAFEIFLSLYQQMVDRQEFIGYTTEYLRKQFNFFYKSGHASLYIAVLQEKPVAATIFFQYGDTTTYHHSASIPVAKFSPQAFILWHAMKDAKKRGNVWFDLFGIAPPGKRYQSRIGLTKFKEGFGGEEWQWARTHDLPFNTVKYLISMLIENLPTGLRRSGVSIFKKIL